MFVDLQGQEKNAKINNSGVVQANMYSTTSGCNLPSITPHSDFIEKTAAFVDATGLKKNGKVDNSGNVYAVIT